MQTIDWNEFRRKNKNPQLAFQDLTYFLFSREFGLSNGVFGYKNQTGIEKEPIEEAERNTEPAITADVLLKRIKKLDSPRKVKAFYRQLEDYKNGLILSSKELWEALLEKTFGITGGIKLLTNYLQHSNYPHTDWHTTNSKYFHIGLAAALSNINTRPEAIKHLYKDTGHGGFSNMIKTYEQLGDKDMCRALFYRYLKLCHFLSE